MKTRIITAVVAIAAVLGLLMIRTTFVIPMVVMVLSVIAGYEIFRVADNMDRRAFGIATAVYLAVMPYVAWGYLSFLSSEIWTAVYGIAFAACLVLKFEAAAVPKQFLCLGMAVFVAYGFSAILKMLPTAHGLFLFLTAAFCAWLCDAGAYFAGTLFGKHKLCRVLSPKKTVEGAIGGVVSCLISVVLLGVVYTACVPGEGKVHYLPLIVTALIGSVLGMIGDLFASAVKRCYGVKDYGNLFPGHGGVLDRVDSALLTFPCVLLIHTYFPLIG